MATFSETLNSFSGKNIQYKSSEFYTDPQNRLVMGKLSNYGDGAYVGLLDFTSLYDKKWEDKIIKKIILTFSVTGLNGNIRIAGYSYEPPDEQLGLNYVQENLFSKDMDKPSGESSANYTLEFSNEVNNTEFQALSEFLKVGNKRLCLYDNIVTNDIYYHTSITIQIDYEEGVIYYGITDTKTGTNIWQPCLIYYGVSGAWKQVTPYYGVSGAWKQVGK